MRIGALHAPRPRADPPVSPTSTECVKAAEAAVASAFPAFLMLAAVLRISLTGGLGRRCSRLCRLRKKRRSTVGHQLVCSRDPGAPILRWLRAVTRPTGRRPPRRPSPRSAVPRRSPAHRQPSPPRSARPACPARTSQRVTAAGAASPPEVVPYRAEEVRYQLIELVDVDPPNFGQLIRAAHRRRGRVIDVARDVDQPPATSRVHTMPKLRAGGGLQARLLARRRPDSAPCGSRVRPSAARLGTVAVLSEPEPAAALGAILDLFADQVDGLPEPVRAHGLRVAREVSAEAAGAAPSQRHGKAVGLGRRIQWVVRCRYARRPPAYPAQSGSA